MKLSYPLSTTPTTNDETIQPPNYPAFVWKDIKKSAQITHNFCQIPISSYFFPLFLSARFAIRVLRVLFPIHYSPFPIHNSPLTMLHFPLTQHLNRGSTPPPYLPSSFLLFSKTPYIGFQLKSPPSTNCLNIIEPRFEPPTARGRKARLHPSANAATRKSSFISLSSFLFLLPHSPLTDQ